MTDPEKSIFDKHPFLLNEYFISFFVSLIVFVLVKLSDSELKVIKDLVYHILISVAFGSLSVSILTLIRVRKDNKFANDLISYQNKKENDQIVEIITNKIEQKLYRKLVSTNALISNRDNKIALTARIIDDFPDRGIYEQYIDKEKAESIDLVRMLSYQNLLLTPKYLEYFFYRKDSVKKARRVIVLDKDQLNGKICQATLTYIFLSARYGYETYIIPELRFKEFVKKYCKIDGKNKEEKEKQIEKLCMIKGNPFILKSTDKVESYNGEYTDFQINYESYGQKKNFSGIEYWILLENLIRNSILIEPNSNGFSDTIIGKVAHISSLPLK
jgi:hypothetical protein